MTTPFAQRIEKFTDVAYEWLRENTSLDEIAATELAESLADEVRDTVLTNKSNAEPS